MKQQLMEQLANIAKQAHDELVPFGDVVGLNLTSRAETQVWQRLNAPVNFVKGLSCLTRRAILEELIAGSGRQDDVVLARFWGDSCRAVVSDDYTVLPHHVVVGALCDTAGLEIQKFYPTVIDENTGTLHIRCVFPGTEYEIDRAFGRGQLMMHVTNSEVGTAALAIRIGIFVLDIIEQTSDEMLHLGHGSPTLFDFFMALTRAAQRYDRADAQLAVETRASNMLHNTEWLTQEPKPAVCGSCGRVIGESHANRHSESR